MADYRAFDEFEGIQVAWNQVKHSDFLQNPEELERLYYEIHLLKTLKHNNIMKFYTSCVDTGNRNINFITEMFTSGTLKQKYAAKRKVVDIWGCKDCGKVKTGGAYTLNTASAVTVRSTIRSLSEKTES
ncbi:hypothetical protein EZV62_011009 [Acer yangbiense]|uniref:non-specific serine/threonine protein kinase n=1 Tax=Acer yangbiense TaxID=1000413 RepID=A0A5C7I4H7_9ROSI|nr:hypothetical protein EZV62_011009 [Acer yangbiense]